MRINKYFSQRLSYILFTLLIISGCDKADFLDTKPSSSILEPKTISDFQQLLEDNAFTMNYTGALAQMGADDYYVSDADYETATITERNSYIWAKDIYGGEVAIPDWDKLYKQVFTANVVLDGLSNNKLDETSDGLYLKGWALFCRAYAFYDLTRTFCKPYDEMTASTDLGIPLRLSSNIDYLEQRASLKETFDQIFSDLIISEDLLPSERSSSNFNRPTKIAVFALLSRIYLDMRRYEEAEIYADKCLELYDNLIDYNSANVTAVTPFSNTNDELIFFSRQVLSYSTFTINTASTKSKISPELLNLYQEGDLRKALYYRVLSDGTYGKKRGYNGPGNYHFTGLATDEIYLIKAECLARKNQTELAMEWLNKLLIMRYDRITIIFSKHCFTVF